MPSLKGNRPEEVIRAFEKAGFSILRQTGAHVIMGKEGHPFILSIPLHANRPVESGLLRREIRKAGLSVEEFLDLL